MRNSGDFTAVLRTGRRVRSGAIVLHHQPRLADAGESAPALVGLVVSRAVGNSVTRHRVSRRLRAQLAARLERLPAGSGTVVRALPESAPADSGALGADLERGFGRLGLGPGSTTASAAVASNTGNRA